MTESLDHRFTKFLLEAQALKFGEFTLKSGRKSPYFINAGAFNDGRKIAALGAFYAEKISQAIMHNTIPRNIDPVFGPAYKGIPLGVSTAIALTSGHGMEVGYTFDRKEKKDHGDGGMMVGTQLTDGMKVLKNKDGVRNTQYARSFPSSRPKRMWRSSAWCFPWIVWKRPRIPTRPR